MQRLAKRAQDLDLPMKPTRMPSPPRMPGSGGSAAWRRARVRPWASQAPSRVGVQRPPRSQSKAGTRRCPPHRSRSLAACADDAVTISWGPRRRARPGRGLRSGPSRDRTRRRAAGRSTRSMRLARRNLRWAHIPLAGPAPELCGVHFAKRVVRQGFCGPTPHNEILNITAGTSSCRAGFAPAEAQCLSWRTFVHDLAVE